MTGADVMAENLLFATLDPTMRQIALPGLDKAILSDTVGFVSDLPTQLVAAFRATLEEVTAADLIIHVRDVAHPDSEAQRNDVLTVLAEIGIGTDGEEGATILEAWNKLDLLDEEGRAELLGDAARRDDVVLLSALTGEGVEVLRRTVSDRLSSGAELHEIAIPAGDGAAVAWLHEHGEVLRQESDGETVKLSARLSELAWQRFNARG